MNNADRIISLWKMYGSHELARACMRSMVYSGCPPLAPTRGNESNGKRRRKGERIEGKRETVRGKGRKECDRERAGGEGEGEICGSVNHGKDADRVDAAPWIFVHETRSRERNTASSHPALEDR